MIPIHTVANSILLKRGSPLLTRGMYKVTIGGQAHTSHRAHQACPQGPAVLGGPKLYGDCLKNFA